MEDLYIDSLKQAIIKQGSAPGDGRGREVKDGQSIIIRKYGNDGFKTLVRKGYVWL